MSKRILKRWTEDELTQIKEFFKIDRTKVEKDLLSAKLGRTWPSIYNKNWDKNHPEAKIKARAKAKSYKPRVSKKEGEITVTHVNPKTPVSTTIKIGEVIIETYASKIKINDVLIEV